MMTKNKSSKKGSSKASNVKDKDASQSKSKATSKQKEDTASKELLEKNERLRGQISVLQKKIQSFEDFQQGISRVVLGNEEEEEKKVKASDVLSEVQDLKKTLAEKETELEKNAYIDSLEEVSESRKKFLKNQIKGTKNIEDKVAAQLKELDRIYKEETEARTGTDRRPVSEGLPGVEDTKDARKILENKEKYKKAWGI